jgi:hypothetical protein
VELEENLEAVEKKIITKAESKAYTVNVQPPCSFFFARSAKMVLCRQKRLRLWDH